MNEISIIIPTLSRENQLYNTIKYLSSQLFIKFEIIIIDQNKKFNLQYYKKIQTYFNKISLKIIRQKEPNASKARNEGVKISKYEIVLFLDDDVKIKNKLFLHNHVKNYINSKNFITAGKILDFPFEFQNRKINIKNYYFFSLNNNKKIKLYGIGRSCNLSVRKNVYFDLGGMDENFVNGAHKEETDFLFRAKKKKIKVLFDPKCCLIHLKNKTGGIRSFNLISKIFYSMFGDLYFSMKHFFNSNLILNIYFFLRRFFINRNSINIYNFIVTLLVFFPAFFYAISIQTKNFILKKK